MGKIKIALICHFSNPLVRGNMQLSNKRVFNFVRKMLGMPPKNGYGDIAAWDTNFIDNFKTRDDVELTVISAHSGLKKSVVNFQAEGVNYYFVCCDFTNFLKRVVGSPKLWNKLHPMRPKVHKIIEQLKPDIVALMGSENPHYAGTVLGLERKYPVIYKSQTIYNNPDRGKYMKVNEKNAYIERLVLKSIHYAAVNTKMHYKLYRTFNKDSYNFNWPLGTTYPEVIPVKEKEFDFVNFAFSMIPAKGFPDAIKALAIVKKQHPNVKMNLIGTPTPNDKTLYDNLIRENVLEDNIVITPFFANQSDMFQHIQKSRFALLPYTLDSIASTTYQAMYYELPVIVYKTMGTPTLNKDSECVLIAEMDDVNDLAYKMLELLKNPDKANTLRVNAKALVDNKKDGRRISDHLMRVFKSVIDNYNNGKEIPADLICDPTK